MISRELLSEVLGKHTTYSYIKVTEDFVQYVDDECYNPIRIDIYRMAHKCKVWAISNQFCISSGNGMLKDNGFYCSIDGFIPIEEHITYADTEPEAIFKAAQYILDNRDE